MSLYYTYCNNKHVNTIIMYMYTLQGRITCLLAKSYLEEIGPIAFETV